MALIENGEGLEGRTILVTGGAGQIGGELIPRLLAQGARVLVLDRKPPEALGLLASRRESGLEYCQCDLSNPKAIRRIASPRFGGVEQLVHLAATVSNDPSTGPGVVRDFQAEVLGTLALLAALPSLRGVCYSSSIMVYGSAMRPRIDEEHPTEPENSYGTLKLAVENILRLRAEQTGCRLVILRFCSIYGVSLAGSRAIPAFVRAALEDQPPVVSGGGSVERDYLYIDDAIHALLLAITQKVDGVFNIGSGTGKTTLGLAEAVIRSAGKQLTPIVRGRTDSLASRSSLVYDVRKANRILGFRASCDIDSGLKKLISAALKGTEATPDNQHPGDGNIA